MITNPQPDSELDKLYKEFQGHSHLAGLRAVYEQGLADFKAFLSKAEEKVETIDGPNGPDAPFIKTQGGAPLKW